MLIEAVRVEGQGMSGRRIRVGKYLLDPERKVLSLDGREIDVGWRAFEALQLLAQSRGEIVDRQTLFERLWPGLAVEETSLTKVISQLRRTLSEGDPGAEYIQTVARMGYRLIVPVSNPAADEPARRMRRSRKLVLGLSLAVVAAAASASGWQWWEGRQRVSRAEAFHREGQRLRRLGDPESIQAAINNYQEAIQLNPRKAQYYASLAEALGRLATADRPDKNPIKEAAGRAVELDPRCGPCQAVLGFTLFAHFWEWQAAGRHLQQALRLSPRDGGVLGYLAMYHTGQGRLEEALAQVEAGIQAEPYAATLHQIRAAILCCMRRYAEAVAAADRAIALQPGHFAARDWRAHALMLQGRQTEALMAYAELGWESRSAELYELHRRSGRDAVLRKLLEWTAVPPQAGQSYRRARWRMYLHDGEGALKELESALAARHFNLLYLAVDPVFDPLRASAHYQAIQARVNPGGNSE